MAGGAWGRDEKTTTVAPALTVRVMCGFCGVGIRRGCGVIRFGGRCRRCRRLHLHGGKRAWCCSQRCLEDNGRFPLFVFFELNLVFSFSRSSPSPSS